jgi:hypothetical protein
VIINSLFDFFGSEPAGRRFTLDQILFPSLDEETVSSVTLPHAATDPRPR